MVFGLSRRRCLGVAWLCLCSGVGVTFLPRGRRMLGACVSHRRYLPVASVLLYRYYWPDLPDDSVNFG
jgi:hypothetical protein